MRSGHQSKKDTKSNRWKIDRRIYSIVSISNWQCVKPLTVVNTTKNWYNQTCVYICDVVEYSTRSLKKKKASVSLLNSCLSHFLKHLDKLYVFKFDNKWSLQVVACLTNWMWMYVCLTNYSFIFSPFIGKWSHSNLTINKCVSGSLSCMLSGIYNFYYVGCFK